MSGRRVDGFWPFLPTAWLSSNRGDRHAVTVRGKEIPFDLTAKAISGSKMRMRADAHTWLLNIARKHGIKTPFQYARLSCVYHVTTPRSDGLYRATDVTNAIYSHKAFYDGMKDAGLIVDDDWKHLELGIQRVRRVKERGQEGVQFILEEVDFEE